MPDEIKELNPQIREVPIGTRELRKIKIYPLSLGDQLKLTEIVTQSLAQWVEQHPNEQLTAESVTSIINLAQTKIHDLMKIVFGCKRKEEVQKIMDDMTNEQLSRVVTLVWQDNYEGPIKNVKSLFQMWGKTESLAQVLERPSPQSVKSMDINSETSLDDHLETEG